MPFAPKKLKKNIERTRQCPEGFKLDSKTGECTKDKTYIKPAELGNPFKGKNGLNPLLKGKKGVIVKSKKKK